MRVREEGEQNLINNIIQLFGLVIDGNKRNTLRQQNTAISWHRFATTIVNRNLVHEQREITQSQSSKVKPKVGIELNQSQYQAPTNQLELWISVTLKNYPIRA